MEIGSYRLSNNLILAPMAGVSDSPFRELCKKNGAGGAVSEMVSANPALRQHKRTLLKTNFENEDGLRWVQILGTDPELMADAARFNVDMGAQIIDINMGCPAKKVCSVSAGSALLRDEILVKRILIAVVNAVDIPVTLKIRTGWDLNSRNALEIAKIAEDSGISALTIHGRTRACKFNSYAEYETIKNVKQSINIPVIANGDIDCAKKAKYVLDTTGADALMIGRAAQGNPWIFRQIRYFVNNKKHLEKPDVKEIQTTLLGHLEALYSFYGETNGVRIARKHIGWYLQHFDKLDLKIKNNIYLAQKPSIQMAMVNSAFNFFSTDSIVSHGSNSKKS